MRDNHRADMLAAKDDILAANERTVKAMRDTIIVLHEQIEYLRAKLDGQAFVSAATVAANPTEQVPADAEGPKWLSEEEEELLALKLNGYIDEGQMRSKMEELGITTNLHVLPSE